MDFPALVGVGNAAFVSTNIDDLFILMVFFATPRFPSSQIVLGQYIGIGSLIGHKKGDEEDDEKISQHRK